MARRFAIAIVSVWLALLATPLRAEPVSFRHDVMAVLSKAGCNQGTCHGNQNGKNGFKLSLRGDDPRFDLVALTRDQFNRRVDALEPARSLLLLKAVGQVPHGGGRRFSPESPEYAILRRWIAEGLREDPSGQPSLVGIEVAPRQEYLPAERPSVQLRVMATFSDGSQRDVTRWAVYTLSTPIVEISPEGLVRRERDGETSIIARYLQRQATVQLAFLPERPGFVWRDVPEHNFVDQHVFAKLKRLRMNPSELSSDTVFLRRASLDLTGLLPTAERARSFAADARVDKRARLVDELLASPEFADFWALKWSDLLRNEEKTLDRKGVQAFHHWIRESIAANRPLDAFVRDIVAARGSTYREPAANYYRANRDAVTRAEATAQLFLGIRLQCAKCHNHPFDRWTQRDYYDWASVFARVQYKIPEVRRRDKNDQHEFDGEQIVWMARHGELEDPHTGEHAHPRFLGAKMEPLADNVDRLDALADWLTARDNRLFARTQVNRVWFHLLGRGIVDPIDDVRATNPPSNAPLLDALAEDFVADGFDLRSLIRTITASRVYQLSAEPNATNAEDEANFAHALVRPLSAEQLLDALNQVTGTTSKFDGYPVGLRAVQLPGVRPARRKEISATGGDQFLEQFGKPPRLLTCECERSTESTLGQAFQLISGPTINELLAAPDNALARWLASGRDDATIVDDLYWSALGRAPSAEELQAAGRWLREAPDRRAALEDIVWAVLNAKEFLLRQ